ncbi:MAG: hypothetical protein CVU89_11655 [Firmicutes bacterium HGW-Firmicutes-14]|nr:MAG: hypothetical protein CVU89_11655 [Firmicutes bacterium HGW-Firmicutes-14]
MRLTGMVLMISLSLLFTGCTANVEKELEETISNYNTNLIMALKGMKPELLKGVATDKEMGAVEIFIIEMADENITVDSTLTEIKFKEFHVPTPGTAVVKAEEFWSFRHLDINTRKPLEESRNIHYETTYTLIKENGRWLVDNIEFIEEIVKQNAD